MRLFPLLHGVIRLPQGNEKALENYCWRKGPCLRDGVLHEHECLFIDSRVQQSMREAECTVNVCPTVLALLREHESPAAAVYAVTHLPSMHLCESQIRPAQGF